jgi:predicted dehydrogenase
MSRHVSRRTFLKRTGTATAVVWGAPAILRGQLNEQKLRVAFVGTGGRGGAHIQEAEKNGCVCPCFADVDTRRWGEATKRWPNAKGYQDYRKMLEKEAANIDVVMVATPDHHHYPATILAMQLGKHVYTEKPLTHTIWEARQLFLAHQKYSKLVTQMGNQGHANEGNRLMVEWIRQGAIGKVKEIHVWTNRPIWPQPVRTPEGEDPVPPELDWDCWIGPAPMRKFKAKYPNGKDVYHPFAWRGWWDFGGGALADMGCHTADCAIWAMEPDAPTQVEVIECGEMPEGNFPDKSKLRFRFPAKGDQPAFDLYWYDGGLKPPRPEFLEPDREMPKTGALFIGEKGGLLSAGDYGDSPRLIPESLMREVGKPKQMLERSPGHFKEFFMACRGEQPREFARSNFSYAARLTELILLGNLALRAGPGKSFGWNSQELKVTGLPELQQFVDKKYRAGWEFREI